MTPHPHVGNSDADMRFRLEFSGRESILQAKLLRQLLENLPEDAHADRARMYAKLTGTLLRTEPDAALASSQKSVEHAQKAGDEIAEAWGLLAQSVVDLSPASTEFRLSAARRIRDIAKKTDSAGCFDPAYFLLLGALLELGRIHDLDLELSPNGPTLSYFPELDNSRHVSWLRFVRSVIDGNSENAENFVQEGYRRAVAADDYDADFVLTAQLSMLYHLHGEGEKMESCFLIGRQLFPEEIVWTCGLAWVWAKQGKLSAARGLVESVGTIRSWPVDRNWLVAGCLLADTLGLVDVTDGAEELYRSLEPYSERLASFGSGVALWAPVARSLGILCSLLGRPEESVEYFRTSLQVCARIGAQPWLVEAQLELSEALMAQDREGNADEISLLLTEASVIAESLQLQPYIEHSASLFQSLGRETWSEVTGDKASRPQGVQIRVLGTFEVTATNGRPAVLHSKKARDLLKLLISRRGTAIHKDRVMATLWPDVPLDSLGNRCAVAVSTVRRALDPDKVFEADHFLATGLELIHLKLENLELDVETFLRSASAALSQRDDTDQSLARLERSVNLYFGEVFPEDQCDALWAERLKIETRAMFCSVAHAYAEHSGKKGHLHNRAETYRRILEVDPQDARAHEMLIETYVALEAPRMARAAKEDYKNAMAEAARSQTDSSS